MAATVDAPVAVPFTPAVVFAEAVVLVVAAGVEAVVVVSGAPLDEVAASVTSFG
jgi:hypothetical protein